MRSVKITVAAGLALIAAIGAFTLTRSPPRVVRVGVPGGENGGTKLLAEVQNKVAICQAGEALPAGVSAIRLSLWGFYGAHVHVRVYSGSQLLTSGQRGPDWTSDTVTVPVKPLSRTTANVSLCFAIGPNSQPIDLLGVNTPAPASDVVASNDTPTPAAAASEQALLGGRVGVEYLASGEGSWWSRILPVARRLGLGRSYSGTWIALLLAALMAAVAALAVRLTLRELP
jgi:hypothetical protein